MAIPIRASQAVLVAGIMAISGRIGRPDLAFATFAAASLLAGLACTRLPVPGLLPAAAVPGPIPVPAASPGEAAG